MKIVFVETPKTCKECKYWVASTQTCGLKECRYSAYKGR